MLFGSPQSTGFRTDTIIMMSPTMNSPVFWQRQTNEWGAATDNLATSQKFQITGEYLYIKLRICLKLKPNPSLCPQDTSWLNICLSARKLQIHRHICTSPQGASEKVCFRSSIPKPSSGTTVNIINILVVTIYYMVYSGFCLLISSISSKWKLFSISCIMAFRGVSPSFSAYQAPHEAGRWAPQGSKGVNPRELGMLGTWWFQISKVIEIIRAY